MVSLGLFIWDSIIQELLDVVEQSEGQSDIQNHSGKPWDSPLVEASDALSLEDCFEAVYGSVVLLGIESLHVGLDHVDWSVG